PLHTRRPPRSIPFPYTTLFRSRLLRRVPPFQPGRLMKQEKVPRRSPWVISIATALSISLWRTTQGSPSCWVKEMERSLNPQPLRSEEHTSELQSLAYLVCRLLL